MTKTEYLFGHKKEKYGPELERIANERIADGMILIRRLRERISYLPEKQNKFQAWLHLRVRKVQEAISVWEKILEVEEQ